MNSRVHYDLVVIGSGAAGHHGAIQGAKLGKRVAVIERGSWLGGATINTGTIPSKTVRKPCYGPPITARTSSIGLNGWLPTSLLFTQISFAVMRWMC